MALVPCSECGREVSDKAAACPQCGAPVAQQPTATPVVRVDDDKPSRVKTAEDSVFTRNRGCVDFVFLMAVLLVVVYILTQ